MALQTETEINHESKKLGLIWKRVCRMLSSLGASFSGKLKAAAAASFSWNRLTALFITTKSDRKRSTHLFVVIAIW